MKRLIAALFALSTIAVGAGMATNYAVTQGSGTTFGSLVVSAVNYAQQLVCDPTTPTQCLAVSASGQASIRAASGAIASGAMVDLGAQADSACSTDNGSCSEIALVKRTNQNLTTLNTSVTSSIPAGAAIIGKVGIDQTTPGTTNGVALVGVNGATALAGNGATGTGSARVTVASDNSAVAGFGVGATGSAAPANAAYTGTLQSGATGGQLKGVISCDNHVFKHITSATDTLAVQGVASQSIYICSWRSRAAGTATWFLENTASANANCSSSNTQITGLASEIANSGETWGNAIWSGLKNTAGNGLCINSTGTGGVDIDIWYTQF